MINKGSLLRYIPTVKRFWASKIGSKFGVLGFIRGKILSLTNRPLGNQSPPKHVIWRKTVSTIAKMRSPEAGKNPVKIKK